MADIKISVVCMTYNHKDYIGRALEGFVSQKTNFPFEVIVHDDASTDDTADIVREYEKKYPEIIKPIYQKENLYSRGINAKNKFVLPVIQGEYVALCEGDDYWTDENKLQIQYDYMTAHPECALCTHQATLHNCQKNTDSDLTDENNDRDYTINEVILLKAGHFSTNSILMKKRVYSDFPKALVAKGFSDYQLIINGALNGTVHYIARNMSVYNYAVNGSWSVRISQNKYKYIEHCKEFIRMISVFDKSTEYKYDKEIQQLITKYNYVILKNQGKYFTVKKPPYEQYFTAETQKTGKLKYFVKCLIFRFDFTYKIYQKLKGRN